MKILKSLQEGFTRTKALWKGVLIIWFIYLIMVSFVAVPMKSAFYSGIGDSTITEKLKDGLNVDVLADLGVGFQSIKSFLYSGMMMLFLVAILVNAFFTGGLFSLSRSGEKFSPQLFFRYCAIKFTSFLSVSLIFLVLIIGLIMILIVIPVSVISMTDSASELFTFNAALILSSVFILALVYFLIAADYARAWLSANEKAAVFHAISFGFRQASRSFSSSYPLMLILLIVQFVYVWIVVLILERFMPGSIPGIIILFLLSQLLFYFRLFLRAARYSSMISLLEINQH